MIDDVSWRFQAQIISRIYLFTIILHIALSRNLSDEIFLQLSFSLNLNWRELIIARPKFSAMRIVKIRNSDLLHSFWRCCIRFEGWMDCVRCEDVYPTNKLCLQRSTIPREGWESGESSVQWVITFELYRTGGNKRKPKVNGWFQPLVVLRK